MSEGTGAVTLSGIFQNSPPVVTIHSRIAHLLRDYGPQLTVFTKAEGRENYAVPNGRQSETTVDHDIDRADGCGDRDDHLSGAL